MTPTGKQHCREMWNNPKAAGTRRKGKALSLSLSQENRSLVFPYVAEYMGANEKSGQIIGVS